MLKVHIHMYMSSAFPLAVKYWIGIIGLEPKMYYDWMLECVHDPRQP